MKKFSLSIRFLSNVFVCLLIFTCAIAMFPLQSYAEGGASADLPEWYVTNPDSFVRFHNENAPKVVDDADIFTDAEEAAISEKIEPLVEKYQKDLAVYTNLSSYGYQRNVFGADFYVYNGYGIGDNYDGMVLYICMEPGNREYQTIAFGSARDFLTQQNGNELDDILAAYFKEDKFADGVLSWLDSVDNMFTYGMPALPQWYKDTLNGTLSSELKNTKIINEIGANLSDEKKAEFQSIIDEYREKYGLDVVIWLTDRAYDLNNNGLVGEERIQVYCDLFWQTVGFGVGDTKSGILMAYFADESFIYNLQVRTYGDANTRLRFSDKINERLAELSGEGIHSEHYENNISVFLTNLGRFLKSHHLPMKTGIKVLCGILCVMAGLVSGFVSTAIAGKKMKTVKKQTTAEDALVVGSFKVYNTGKQHIGAHTVRTHIVRTNSGRSGHSGGGSAGHSSYTSSGKSSSGVSFTSSGRKF